MDAINAAKMAGASYADARIARIRQNFVVTREQQIVNVVDTDTLGCGVRALVDGCWGFAATRTLTRDAIAAAAREAVAIAKANRVARDRSVELAPVQAYPNAGSRYTFTGTLDLRVQKGFPVGSGRVAVVLDAYNLFTRNNEVEEYVVSGQAFRTPTAIQPPRVVHVGARVTF